MKKQILFIDDELSILEGLQWMLRPEQDLWQGHFVQSVDEAWVEIEQTEFDVIVTDVSMPKKDGFDLLRRLQRWAATKDIPVIILTGRADHAMKRRALEMGATDLLSKPVDAENLLARLTSALRLKAYQDELKVQKVMLEAQVKQRTAELEESWLDIVLRLGKAAEYRDEETGNHTLRVGCYCRAIGQEMDRSRDFAEKIFLTSPMHDIGKIGISDLILMKPGRLTAAERKIMERHCVIGYEILTHEPEGLKPFLKWHRDYTVLRRCKNPILEMAAAIALGHHERWDGAGYPQQLKGANTPLAARIAGLADVYDALRTERPYKEAFSEEKTLAIMREEEKKHFDPEVFAAFERLTDIFNDIHGQFSDKTSKEGVLQA